MLDAADTRSLALIYHLNSEPSVNEAYEEAYDPRFKGSGADTEGIPLARSDQAGALLEMIGRRRSCRQFAAQRLRRDELAEILVGTYGSMGAVSLGGGIELDARSI